MMNVAWVGIGKLGYVCAYTAARAGHRVMGYDINPDAMNTQPRLYKEAKENGTGDFNDYLGENFDLPENFMFCDLEVAVMQADIVFVAVQTPHEEKFEGITRIPEDDRADFNYDSLIMAVSEICQYVRKPTPIVVISTVLPGTMEREIKPVMAENPYAHLCYSPQFIAMGTTMRDYLNPEFVLLGVDDEWAAEVATQYYKDLLGDDAPIRRMSVASAELTKVAYNTYIGMKIVFANNLMEICHHIDGADVDDVTDAIKAAHNRLISPAYLSGGMGDGGGCHPRDNIALSWLAKELELSTDFCEDIMYAREDQADFLCELVMDAHAEIWERNQDAWEKHNLDISIKPILILGSAFKPETNITVGSPAILCKNIIEDYGYHVIQYDPHVDDHGFGFSGSSPAMAILIGTKHTEFTQWRFPQGSIVIDPFRYIPDQEGVTVVRVGETRQAK